MGIKGRASQVDSTHSTKQAVIVIVTNRAVPSRRSRGCAVKLGSNPGFTAQESCDLGCIPSKGSRSSSEKWGVI